MTDVVIWPRSLFPPRHVAINPAPVTLSGPVSLSGFRQAIASPAAVWAIKYDLMRVTQSGRLPWRALAAQIEGRATPIVLPVYDREQLRPLAALASGGVTHSDGSSLSDGSLYRGGRVQVIAAAAAVAGAATLDVERIASGTLRPGMHFSIGLRLYRIKSVLSASGAMATLGIWPTLREAVLAGAELEFDEPVCKVRLADDGGLDLTLDTGRHALPSVSFIEDPS